MFNPKTHFGVDSFFKKRVTDREIRSPTRTPNFGVGARPREIGRARSGVGHDVSKQRPFHGTSGTWMSSSGAYVSLIGAQVTITPDNLHHYCRHGAWRRAGCAQACAMWIMIWQRGIAHTASPGMPWSAVNNRINAWDAHTDPHLCMKSCTRRCAY